jgi:hypothetical protein
MTRPGPREALKIMRENANNPLLEQHAMDATDMAQWAELSSADKFEFLVRSMMTLNTSMKVLHMMVAGLFSSEEPEIPN